MMLAGFPAREATGTSLAAIVITATVGATLYAIEGEVDFARAALVGIPAVGGVLFGTALQQRIPARNLTFAFAALLVGLGLWMLLGDGTEAAAGSSADTRTIVAALAAGVAAESSPGCSASAAASSSCPPSPPSVSASSRPRRRRSSP